MIAGDLQKRLDRYLEFRRASGFKMRAEKTLLPGFIAFIHSHGQGQSISAKTALEWAKSSGCGPSGQAARLSMARQFLIFLKASDLETEVPQPGLLPFPRRPIPHIYSDDEIERILAQARRLGPQGSLRPHTYVTLIGILASCGLRVGEAIRLRVVDVQLTADPPRLRVLNSKFGKSRLVPVHPTSAAALTTYAEQRRELGYNGYCETFLVSERFSPLNRYIVMRTFKKLVHDADIVDRSVDHRRPTAHQLRHTFAVRRIVVWLREGKNVHERLPELSVYLGHQRPEETYWYLTATPELLRLASDRFEMSCDIRGDQ